MECPWEPQVPATADEMKQRDIEYAASNAYKYELMLDSLLEWLEAFIEEKKMPMFLSEIASSQMIGDRLIYHWTTRIKGDK